MKLKIFDRTNVEIPVRSGLRSIHICRVNGTVTFSKVAAKDLDIKTGKFVFIAQNEDNEGDWFISISNDGNGFPVNMKKNSGWAKGVAPSAYFICRFLVNKLLDSVKVPKSASFLIGANPVKADGMDWYKIVTSRPIKKR